MSEIKKILITGGAGYIGSHTILELLETTNCEVISIDDFSNSSPEIFSRIEKISGKKVKNYAVDLCDTAATRKIFKENIAISGVIHFAAFKSVPESVADPLKYYRNNIGSLLSVLDCLQEFRVENFIFSSSCSVYGNAKQQPVDENTPFGKAESPYGYTKQLGEVITEKFSKSDSAQRSISLRYFNPVGAHVSGLTGESHKQTTSLVPVITRTAAGKRKELFVHGSDYPTRDGSCIRDYVHVSDIATAHILALQFLSEKKSKNNYNVFNLGSGNGVTVLEAIHSFEKISGIKLYYSIGERRAGDVAAIYSNNTKATNELGWKPKYSLDDMMRTAWVWEKNNPE